MTKKTLVETVLENRKRPVADDFRPVAKPVFDEHGNMDAFEAFMRGATKRQIEEHGRKHLQKDKP
jgi:hypothetical protein